MTSNRARAAAVFALTIGIFLTTSLFAAPPLEERVVLESASFDTAGYGVQLVGLVEEDETSKIVFRAKNNGASTIDRIEVEIEEWNEGGWLEGGASYVIWATLGPGEERLFSEAIRPSSSSTYVLRATDPRDRSNAEIGVPGLARKFAISTCANYCDRCSDKAGDRCIGGVMEVDCTCNETSASCRYSCYPPPV